MTLSPGTRVFAEPEPGVVEIGTVQCLYLSGDYLVRLDHTGLCKLPATSLREVQYKPRPRIAGEGSVA